MTKIVPPLSIGPLMVRLDHLMKLLQDGMPSRSMRTEVNVVYLLTLGAGGVQLLNRHQFHTLQSQQVKMDTPA